MLATMYHEAYQQLLQQLRQLRHKRGYTQAEVAAGIRLSRSQYTAIEQGRSVLNWHHLQKLAKFLDTKFTVRG